MSLPCARRASRAPEFCSRGSVYDVLRAAAQDPAKAAELTWRRRLGIAIDAATGMLCAAGWLCTAPAERLERRARAVVGAAAAPACSQLLSNCRHHCRRLAPPAGTCTGATRPSSTATSRAPTCCWTRTGCARWQVSLRRRSGGAPPCHHAALGCSSCTSALKPVRLGPPCWRHPRLAYPACTPPATCRLQPVEERAGLRGGGRPVRALHVSRRHQPTVAGARGAARQEGGGRVRRLLLWWVPPPAGWPVGRSQPDGTRPTCSAGASTHASSAPDPS